MVLSLSGSVSCLYSAPWAASAPLGVFFFLLTNGLQEFSHISSVFQKAMENFKASGELIEIQSYQYDALFMLLVFCVRNDVL